MEEVDKLLNGDDSVQPKGDKPDGETTDTPKTFEINGRKYTAEQVEDMAKDYANLSKKTGQLADEVGKLRKETTKKEDKPAETPQEELTPEQIAQARKVLGIVTEEDLDRREYVNKADNKIKEISKKYGLDSEAFGKELVDIGVRLDPEKFEKVWIANHPDEYLKWRKENMKKDQPVTPYTVRTVKEGLDLPSAPKPRFGETVVSRALELIGQTGE